jgi:hypothetical protein
MFNVGSLECEIMSLHLATQPFDPSEGLSNEPLFLLIVQLNRSRRT